MDQLSRTNCVKNTFLVMQEGWIILDVRPPTEVSKVGLHSIGWSKGTRSLPQSDCWQYWSYQTQVVERAPDKQKVEGSIPRARIGLSP